MWSQHFSTLVPRPIGRHFANCCFFFREIDEHFVAQNYLLGDGPTPSTNDSMVWCHVGVSVIWVDNYSSGNFQATYVHVQNNMKWSAVSDYAPNMVDWYLELRVQYMRERRKPSYSNKTHRGIVFFIYHGYQIPYMKSVDYPGSSTIHYFCSLYLVWCDMNYASSLKFSKKE